MNEWILVFVQVLIDHSTFCVQLVTLRFSYLSYMKKETDSWKNLCKLLYDFLTIVGPSHHSN